MALFGGTSKTQVGVDIGTSSIKIVEVSVDKQGTGKLLNYALVDFQQIEDVSVRNWDPSQISKMIKELISKSKIKSKKVGISVGVDESFTTYLRLPMVEQKDLENAIAYEVKKFIPMDLTEVKLGSEILKRDSKTNEIHALVVAVPNTVVAKYRQIAKEIGLSLITLEVETFSLVRIFLKNVSGVTLLVDIGALKTTLSVVKDENAMMNSSIDMGGAHFTKAVSQGLNVAENRAEAMKVKEGMGGQAQEVIRSQANRLLTEIANTVNVFESEHGEKVNQMLILGSTSQMAGFNDHVVQSIGDVQIMEVNPFQFVTPPQKIPEGMLVGLGMRLSVAMGLALKPED